MKYTPEEIAEIRHLIKNYTQMSHECREKYLIFGDGVVIGSKIKEA